jgi:tripartite-type tricarboxylate transporter receptor subunit TctC
MATPTPHRARLSILGLMVATALAAAWPAHAQAQAKAPLNLMVPYPAGGLSDVIARLVERPLAKTLGQQVIVENLGGVGGAIAAQKVLAAPADGAWLYQGSPNELILAPMALQAVKYRAEDWRMVQIIGAFPMAVLARKGLPANTVDELVALARKADADGKPLTYASVGIGSFYHVVGEHFAQTVGAKMMHVPYKGGAPMLQDLGGDRVDLAFFVVDSRLPSFVSQGMYKVLATLAPAGRPEAEFLKPYPSINDSKAVKNFEFNTWTGYFVRKDTPEPVVQALNKALATAMGDPDSRKKLEDLGGRVPAMMGTAEAQKEYEAQTARFRAIAKSIKLEAQ